MTANRFLNSFEQETARYFMSLADTFHLPRSVALIFAVIFCCEEPVCFEEILKKTGLSKSRVSDGLKLLLENGFVRDVRYDNNRRTFFKPEASLRAWFQGLVHEKITPKIRANGKLVSELRQVYARGGGKSDAVETRLEALANWNKKLQTMLPMILKVMGINGRKLSNPRKKT